MWMSRLMEAISRVCLGLACLLSACRPVPNSEPTAAATPIPSAAALPTARAAPTQTTSACLRTNPAPVFVTLDGDRLWEYAGCAPGREIAALSALGDLRAATYVEGSLFLLRTRALEQMRLDGGTLQTRLPFEPPILFGALLPDLAGARLFYSITWSDWESETGMTTQAGWLEVEGEGHGLIMTRPHPLHLLGPSPDGKGLYILPFGQDPSTRTAWFVDILSGTIEQELPVVVEGAASLSPDGRWLAASAVEHFPGDRLHVYNLPALPHTSAAVFRIPISPSFVGYGGFRWTADSQSVYFLISPDPYEEAPVSEFYGLWRLDVHTGAMTQITPGFENSVYMLSLSPGGEWMLLMSDREEKSFLVDTRSGTIHSYSAPLPAFFTGWR